jgi:hypothetical protein
MKNIIFFLILSINLVLSCSYGLEKPKTIDIDCIDEPPYDVIDPPPVVEPPFVGPPPIDPPPVDPPIDPPPVDPPIDPPPVDPPVDPPIDPPPGIDASIKMNSLALPFPTSASLKAFGTVTVSIEGENFIYPQTLPDGWTFSARSSVASVEVRQLQPNQLRLFVKGFATDPGFIIVELFFEGEVMVRIQLPIT